jgi:hypothetical protein
VTKRERTEKTKRLAELERIIVDAVSGMDPDDSLHRVKVHYADGSTRWLVDVITEANDLRFDLAAAGGSSSGADGMRW